MSDEKFYDPEGREITIAPQERIDDYLGTDVYTIFCVEVLDFQPGDIMLTDESTMSDFPEDLNYYKEKVIEVFNTDLSDTDNPKIVDILDLIIHQRKGKY